MSWQVIIRPKAEADLLRAKTWYDDERAGLGELFVAEIDAALRRVLENPFRQPLYYGAYRRIITRRFPYKIFYAISGERIVVFRVVHTKQDYRALI